MSTVEVVRFKSSDNQRFFKLILGWLWDPSSYFVQTLKQRAFCDTPARQGHQLFYAYIRSSLQNAAHFCRVQVFLQSHSTVVGTQKTQPSFWTSNGRSSDTLLRFRFYI